MKRVIAVLLAGALMTVAAGCQRSHVTSGVVPAVTVRIVTEEHENGAFSIDAEYPQLGGGLEAGIAERINASIEQLVLPDIDEFRRNAVEDMNTSKQGATAGSTPLPAGFAQYLTVRYEIPYLATDIVSVRLRFETYTGGAHGMSYTRVLNARLGDGTVLGTTALFSDATQGLTMLSRSCAADLQRQYGADYEGLKSFVDDGTAPVAENYANVSLEPGFLVVSFDPYQVGPYAAGPREVRIPAGDMKPVLTTIPGEGAFTLTLAPAE